MPTSLLENARRSAVANGFDLFGAVDAERFDACQPRESRVRSLMPQCGVVVVVGCGGPARESSGLPRRLQQLRGILAEQWPGMVVAEPGRSGLSFARLAEAAGFGTVSPVTGLLLHPEYGPWVRVHAALLLAGRPFGALRDATITDEFQPCCKCRQPCLEVFHEPAAACHLGVEHQNGAATPMPQMVAAALRPSPVRWIRLSVRLLPNLLRIRRPRS